MSNILASGSKKKTYQEQVKAACSETKLVKQVNTGSEQKHAPPIPSGATSFLKLCLVW